MLSERVPRPGRHYRVCQGLRAKAPAVFHRDPDQAAVPKTERNPHGTAYVASLIRAVEEQDAERQAVAAAAREHWEQTERAR